MPKYTCFIIIHDIEAPSPIGAAIKFMEEMSACAEFEVTARLDDNLDDEENNYCIIVKKSTEEEMENYQSIEIH